MESSENDDGSLSVLFKSKVDAAGSVVDVRSQASLAQAPSPPAEVEAVPVRRRMALSSAPLPHDPSRPTCTNCRTQTTSLWRKSSTSSDVLCNACSLYKRLKGIDRPLAMKTDIVRSRVRKATSRKTKVESARVASDAAGSGRRLGQQSNGGMERDELENDIDDNVELESDEVFEMIGRKVRRTSSSSSFPTRSGHQPSPYVYSSYYSSATPHSLSYPMHLLPEPTSSSSSSTSTTPRRSQSVDTAFRTHAEAMSGQHPAAASSIGLAAVDSNAIQISNVSTTETAALFDPRGDSHHHDYSNHCRVSETSSPGTAPPSSHFSNFWIPSHHLPSDSPAKPRSPSSHEPMTSPSSTVSYSRTPSHMMHPHLPPHRRSSSPTGSSTTRPVSGLRSTSVSREEPVLENSQAIDSMQFSPGGQTYYSDHQEYQEYRPQQQYRAMEERGRVGPRMPTETTHYPNNSEGWSNDVHVPCGERAEGGARAMKVEEANYGSNTMQSGMAVQDLLDEMRQEDWRTGIGLMGNVTNEQSGANIAARASIDPQIMEEDNISRLASNPLQIVIKLEEGQMGEVEMLRSQVSHLSFLNLELESRLRQIDSDAGPLTSSTISPKREEGD